MIVIIYVHFTSGWTAVSRGELIGRDLENFPFYIKTNSVEGSDEELKFFFYDAHGSGAGGIEIVFTFPPQYHIRTCDPPGRTDFPVTLPSERDKVWKLSLSRTSVVRLVVLCNDQEVLNLEISRSTCAYRYWKSDWSRIVEKVKFPSSDSASDFYFDRFYSPAGKDKRVFKCHSDL